MGDLGIFGQETEAEARSQRKPAERGCKAKEADEDRADPEGIVPREPKEDMIPRADISDISAYICQKRCKSQRP